jgi:hypothetical protein
VYKVCEQRNAHSLRSSRDEGLGRGRGGARGAAGRGRDGGGESRRREPAPKNKIGEAAAFRALSRCSLARTFPKRPRGGAAVKKLRTSLSPGALL